MLEGNRVTYLEIAESHRSMRLAARRGDRDPVHANLPAAIGYGAPATRFPIDRVQEIADMLREVASEVAVELPAPIG